MRLTNEQIEAAEKLAYVEPEIVRSVMARVPPSWRLIEKLPAGGAFRRGNSQVIFTVQKYEDHQIWLHASVCLCVFRGMGTVSYHLPSFEDLKRVKNDFIGSDKWVYQVFPDERHYVNENPYVLHLYALLEDKPALPDFTWGLGTI